VNDENTSRDEREYFSRRLRILLKAREVTSRFRRTLRKASKPLPLYLVTPYKGVDIDKRGFYRKFGKICEKVCFYGLNDGGFKKNE